MGKPKQYIVSVHEDFASENPEAIFLETFYDSLGSEAYREVLGNSPSFHDSAGDSFLVDAYRKLSIAEIGILMRHGFTLFER